MSRLEIPATFHRSGFGMLERAEESARFLIRHVCGEVGLTDLGATELLDVGCGTKFSEAFVNDGIPIKKYVGVDVYGEMIDFLVREVDDPRFEYFHFDVRNELYNPDGTPMTDDADLGVGARTFDLIWLFSVFTHLNPDDFRTMLNILRRYIRPTGTLFFTAFLNERSETGHGASEGIARAIEQAVADGRELPSELVAALERGPEVPRYVDMDPTNPLRYAMYTREYAFELIDGTGWHVEDVIAPNEFAQHQFVCTPG